MLWISPRAAWVCLLLVLINAPLRAAAADITESCEIIVRPIWDEMTRVRQRLEDDPFHDLMDVYRRDLDTLASEHDAMSAQAREWLDRLCMPSLAAARAYRSHCGGTLSPAQAAACQAELANAAEMSRAVVAAGAEHNGKAEELERRLQRALDRANDVLKPEATEPMFRRLAAHVQGTMSDCQALAHLMGALGARVNGDVGQLADVAGRVLSNGVVGGTRGVTITVVAPSPQGYVRFHQSGFRAQYLDPDPDSDNQVRHFVGYFVLGLVGAQHGVNSSRLLEYLADYRDHNQMADYSLGLVAGNMGASVAAQPASLRQLERSIQGAACR